MNFDGKRQLIIALDVDDVCADLITEWLRLYNKDWYDNLKEEQISEWNIANFVKSECGNKIYRYIESPFIYDNVKPVEGACKGVQLLKGLGHRIIFVTHSTMGSSGRKYRWLKAQGMIDREEDYFEAKDKSLIGADILLDDRYKNVNDFKGYGMLFDKAWNRKYQDTHTTFDNWISFVDFISRSY